MSLCHENGTLRGAVFIGVLVRQVPPVCPVVVLGLPDAIAGEFMNRCQPAILEAPVPLQARHLFFSLRSPDELRGALDRLVPWVDGRAVVVGLGQSLVTAMGCCVSGLREFPAFEGSLVEVPVTQFALWCWLRGSDRGELLHLSRRLEVALSPALSLDHAVEAFRHQAGHDLTGYEDGTENPLGEAAVKAAIVVDGEDGELGGSFAVIQRWVHDLDYFESLPGSEQDDIFGRRKSDNEELDEAPESAHVRRTAQESFAPEAFMVRRSMPWVEGARAGLMFLCFGRSFDAFEVQMRRMAGVDDGIVDALYRFSRPVSGGYYWCPPLREGVLDLSGVRVG